MHFCRPTFPTRNHGSGLACLIESRRRARMSRKEKWNAWWCKQAKGKPRRDSGDGGWDEVREWCAPTALEWGWNEKDCRGEARATGRRETDDDLVVEAGRAGDDDLEEKVTEVRERKRVEEREASNKKDGENRKVIVIEEGEEGRKESKDKRPQNERWALTAVDPNASVSTIITLDLGDEQSLNKETHRRGWRKRVLYKVETIVRKSREELKR